MLNDLERIYKLNPEDQNTYAESLDKESGWIRQSFSDRIWMKVVGCFK